MGKWATAILAMVILACAAPVWGQTKGVDEKKAEAIRKAAPDAAPAKPKQPRQVLVFYLTKGFRHGVIPAANLAMQALGEKTGAFEVTLSNDISVFEPQSLARFDAVIMNNTTGELFMPDKKALGKMDEAKRKAAVARSEMLKQSLLDFVRGGKGLVGIHAATDCNYKWAEYGQMIGGYFHGHPWHESVGIKVEEPDHPINAAFNGQDFKITDEIYQFREPYSRRNLRVLLKLDVDNTNMKKRGIKRKDGDFAVSWVKTYGKGRVFYCSLGHRDSVFMTPAVMAHYLAGIQFALGDLEADATPSEASPQVDTEALAKRWGYTPRIGEDGYEVLFDGSNLDAWDYKKGGWVIDEDGALYRAGKAGFIWSKRRYCDFVLDLEFKVAKRTNSGVFIRTDSRRNWLHTGIEVQVLDSAGKDKPGKHDCGAIYDIQPPSKNTMRPAGQWNHMIVTARDNIISVELNGEVINEINLERWTEAGRNPDGTKNKFKYAYRDLAREGYLALQDHGNPVWYRNIRIRPLGDREPQHTGEGPGPQTPGEDKKASE